MQPDASAELLEAALAYAAAGYPVFPVYEPDGDGCSCGRPDCGSPGKHPRTRRGLDEASTDPAIVAEWWRCWPSANIGIRTGTVSGLVVLDVDPRHGGTRTLQEFRREHGPLPRTAQVLTGGGGQQFVFAHPGGTVRNSAGAVGDGLDVRGDGGYIVAAPSLHASGNRYRWLHTLDEAPPAELPAWLRASERRNGTPTAALEEIIPEGKRRAAMLQVAGKLKRAGLGGDEILPTLRKLNERCRPPLDDAELRSVAYPSTIAPDPHAAIPTVPLADARGLEDVVATFRRYLYLPDPSAVHVVLAAEIANRIPAGDPVWVVIVAGSSRGKTELLLALDGLPGVRVVGALTVAALLSGTSRKDRAKNATGGVLVELGDQGLLVVKDFGAILSLHRDTRAQVLQALRDVYDGLYTRDVGADGGTKLEWRGRVGMLAGATSALDQAHAVLSALGERWLTVRLGPGEETDMAKLTLRGMDTATMRAELRAAVQGFLATVQSPPLRRLEHDEEELLAALAVLVCFARSPVERERDYKREIVLVHQPEGPGRMARQLHKLYVALEAMGVDAAHTLVRVGLDSVPSPRREVLLHVLANDGELATAAVAKTLQLPTVSARRALEELAAHRLLAWRKDGDAETSRILWRATEAALEHWREIARHARNPHG
jgi:hypothetical protein